MRRRRRFDLFILREVLGLRNQVEKSMPPTFLVSTFYGSNEKGSDLKIRHGVQKRYTSQKCRLLSHWKIMIPEGVEPSLPRERSIRGTHSIKFHNKL